MCEKKDVYIWLKTEDEGEDKYQSFLNGFGGLYDGSIHH